MRQSKWTRAAIESAKVQLSYCYIRSPIDGRAGQRLVDLGNVVNPGGGSGNHCVSKCGTPAKQRSAGDRATRSYLRRLHDLAKQSYRCAAADARRAGSGLKCGCRMPATNRVFGQLTFLDNAVQDRQPAGNSARDDSQRGTSFLARTLRQHSSGTEHDSSGACWCPLPRRRCRPKDRSFTWSSRTRPPSSDQCHLGQRQGDLIVVENGVAPARRSSSNGQLGVTRAAKSSSSNRAAKSGHSRTAEWMRSNESL